MAELIRIVRERKIKRIIIVEREGHPTGIVSRTGVIKAIENV